MSVVLVVEDDPDLREDLAALIEHRGYQTATAADGREALARLRGAAELPCLVILDLMMPVMDGWALRAEMLKDPRLAVVPVVLLSGIADLRDQATILDVADHLVKPVNLARLYDLLAEHCGPPG